MEEFKRPSLPSASSKVDKPEITTSSCSENAAPTNPTQLCPYKIPEWSDRPNSDTNYSFEVLKSGSIIDEVKELQTKPYWTFGRLPENDIEMAHPTISRFHAILQYRPKCRSDEEAQAGDEDKKSENTFKDKAPPEGWYVFDLGSTHGTFLNKQRLPAKVYIRIRVGHMLRLGASTRTYILQGPSEDEEPESELSITELKEKRQRDLEEAALTKKRLAEETLERAKNEGCGWGMSEDADEETDLTHNPYASTNNEELFLDDPKKTLRGYFEREGLELVYKCDEMSAGSFVCRVELPIDDANGRPIVAEVIHKGKKKDCVHQCALEACRLLDRHGVLRQANQEPLKRKQKSKGSDSDEDEFWDRTGDVARKKQRKANASTSVTLTYEDLLKQENDIDDQIKEIQSKIKQYQEIQQRLKANKSEEGEDLDAFMENLQDKEIQFDKTEIRKLRLEEQRLKSEKQKVQRLIKIAKPLDLPFIKQTIDGEAQIKAQSVVKKQLPMIGKRNQFSKFKVVKIEASVITKESKPLKFLDSDEEEMEEEEITKDAKSKESNSSKEITLDKLTKPEIKDNVEEIHDTEKVNETNDIDSVNISEKKDPLNDNNDKSNETKEENVETLQDLSKTEEDINTDPVNIKKRRQRVRQRGKRQEVDMEDDVEYESSEKYAKWVPPENQTGDGITELNKKFGY